jgi:rare lipoprotein A
MFLPTPADAQQKGKATFYTRKWDGRKTASGERLYNDSLVCAHKTHKFGTLLLVKNPANGKEVVVKVIDRGPYVKGRIIDLSIRAARELGILNQGVAVVEVSVYKKPTEVPYKPEDLPIPEIEIETTNPGTGIIPQWQEEQPSRTDSVSIQQKREKGHGQ